MRDSVEETLNSLQNAEADAMCSAQRYQHSVDRVDTRAGSYERQLHTKAGEVTLKVPKLRRQTFETAIIERYKQREASIEESLIEIYKSFQILSILYLIQTKSRYFISCRGHLFEREIVANLRLNCFVNYIRLWTTVALTILKMKQC